MAAQPSDIIKGLPPIPPHAQDKSVARSGVLIASYQGKRPYQEDRYIVKAGVNVTAKEAPALLADAFKSAAAKTDDMNAGSTATGVVLTKDLQLNVAFIGDSPVVLFIRDPKTGDIDVQKLTRDHSPALPDEKTRIEAEGGIVNGEGRAVGITHGGKRITTLAVSRAFGDKGIRGVSRQPEFAAFDLKKEIDAGRQVYAVISSDGLYDGSVPKDFIAPIKQALAEGKEEKLADVLTAHAYLNGSTDNITALVVKIPTAPEKDLFIALADGHGGALASSTAVRSFSDTLKARSEPQALDKPKPSGKLKP